MEHADRRFGLALCQVVQELPEARSHSERQLRAAVLDDAARWGLRAALVFLARSPRHYRAVVDAARRYARTRLRGEVADFELRPQRGGKLPMEWMLLPQILSVYEALVADLRAAWTGPVRALADPRFLVRDGERYGKPQVIGTAKRNARRRAKLDAVVAAAAKVVPRNVLDYQPSRRKVQAWIEIGSASAVAHEMIADVFNEVRRRSPEVLAALKLDAVKGTKPRPNFTAKSIRSLLARARRQRREAARLRDKVTPPPLTHQSTYPAPDRP